MRLRHALLLAIFTECLLICCKPVLKTSQVDSTKEKKSVPWCPEQTSDEVETLLNSPYDVVREEVFIAALEKGRSKSCATETAGAMNLNAASAVASEKNWLQRLGKQLFVFGKKDSKTGVARKIEVEASGQKEEVVRKTIADVEAKTPKIAEIEKPLEAPVAILANKFELLQNFSTDSTAAFEGFHELFRDHMGTSSLALSEKWREFLKIAKVSVDEPTFQKLAAMRNEGDGLLRPVGNAGDAAVYFHVDLTLKTGEVGKKYKNVRITLNPDAPKSHFFEISNGEFGSTVYDEVLSRIQKYSVKGFRRTTSSGAVTASGVSSGESSFFKDYFEALAEVVIFSTPK